MGFLTIFYKYMIQQEFTVQIFLPHPIASLPDPPDRISGAPSFIRNQCFIHVALRSKVECLTRVVRKGFFHLSDMKIVERSVIIFRVTVNTDIQKDR